MPPLALSLLPLSSSSSSSSHCMSARKFTGALWECITICPISECTTTMPILVISPPGRAAFRSKDGSSRGGGCRFGLSHFLADPPPSSPDQVFVGFLFSFYDLGL